MCARFTLCVSIPMIANEITLSDLPTHKPRGFRELKQFKVS